MNDAEILRDIFEPTDLAIGRAQPLKDDREKGFKVKRKCWTEACKTASLDDFQKHLDGVLGLGLPPIHSDCTCRWGVVDVDKYEGNLEDLVPRIYSIFPFVVCARSKSGGLHIYLFVDEPVPAKDLVAQLRRIASHLGYANQELFPKQTAVSTDSDHPDCGNWINLPYFGGELATNYVFNKQGDAIDSITGFAEFVSRRRTPLKAIEQYNPPEMEGALFADGPPCLEIIWANGVAENRNISLLNAATYLKKKHETGWEDELRKLNHKMADPLPENEVDNIIKSQKKKEYKYQCQTCPLKNFCNSKECSSRPYGIPDTGPLTGNRSLTKLETIPPRWFLDLDVHDQPVRISLSTEELHSPRLFQKRCLEVADFMPVIPSAAKWRRDINEMTHPKNITRITVPKEDTPVGRLRELMSEFFQHSPSENARENLLRGTIYKESDKIMFRLSDLERHLDVHKFKGMNGPQIVAALKNEFGAASSQEWVDGRSIRVWSVSDMYFDKPAEPKKYNEHIEQIF